MGHAVDMENSSFHTEFVEQIQQALGHLYDPSELRKSPLLELFGLAQEEHSASSLRRVLVAAIESRKPDSSVPPDSNAWRDYHTLYYRYVEQFLQSEIAADLGLSTRQLRRLEKGAMEALAGYLWNHYKVADKLAGGENPPALSRDGEPRPGNAMTPSRRQELDWLRNSDPTQPVDPARLVQTSLKLARRLIESANVRIESHLPATLPDLAVHLSPTQQALINVLTVAARRVPGGEIHLEAVALRREVHLHIRAAGQDGTAGTAGREDREQLEMARELVELSGGQLEFSPAEGKSFPLAVRMVLPSVEKISVLAVDDNPDTLYLLERYVAGTRYHLIGTRDPKQVLALARELSPQIIVLDVMLPETDGWELLERLREHPEVRNMPIVICTILPQEQFALTAGATDFIRKPVSRETFLSTLNRQRLAD
jgi:CheY-like chemotaxis protein